MPQIERQERTMQRWKLRIQKRPDGLWILDATDGYEVSDRYEEHRSFTGAALDMGAFFLRCRAAGETWAMPHGVFTIGSAGVPPRCCCGWQGHPHAGPTIVDHLRYYGVIK